MFDIDGVFFKGKYVIEEAKQAVRLLTDENGEWRVPCVWVTNAANPPPIEKAALMSQGLGVKVSCWCGNEKCWMPDTIFLTCFCCADSTRSSAYGTLAAQHVSTISQ